MDKLDIIIEQLNKILKILELQSGSDRIYMRSYTVSVPTSPAKIIVGATSDRRRLTIRNSGNYSIKIGNNTVSANQGQLLRPDESASDIITKNEIYAIAINGSGQVDISEE